MPKTCKIFLKSDQGKYVTLKQTINGWKLCVEDVQNSEVQDLTLWLITENTERQTERQTKNVCFGFVWQKKGTLYSPKVNEDKLELEKLPGSEPPTTLSRNHWFEMINHHLGDGLYGLASVVKPEKHLSLAKNNEVQISAEEQEWIYIKDDVVRCQCRG